MAKLRSFPPRGQKLAPLVEEFVSAVGFDPSSVDATRSALLLLEQEVGKELSSSQLLSLADVMERQTATVRDLARERELAR